ncbi:hypothetical protein [Marinomonas sp.]|uniref:hypothetical protein n=1 Tax=Marinomonas sp. TaxID=1904862 RepID=UPI003F9D5111
MNRNIAFLIHSKKYVTKSMERAEQHLKQLAQRFGYSSEKLEHGEYVIHLICEGEATYQKDDVCLFFPVGNLGNHPLEKDRFLKVSVGEDKVEVINDYAGTVPVFYANRNGLLLSNIEPAAVLATETTAQDISYENVFGFMRYMHFIWEETAYQHIKTMDPDSKYTFFNNSGSIEKLYLKSIEVSEKYATLSDKEVAALLNDLNNKLVISALESYDQIILPLSSGYDSRMILAALSTRPDLKEKLYCFTYGSIGSVEVEAGRRLTAELGVKWDFIDLPLLFLGRGTLEDIDQVFGASLHMHGMYQLEFFREIKKRISIHPNACLTSGFMTGVPAGQHNSLLAIDGNQPLTQGMDKFSQSKYWTNEELEQLNVFKGQDYLNKAEQRFRQAFDRFEGGSITQKAVIFDVWSRQRNFVGYYPRTLEWVIPTVSPHMTKEYAQFFMSLSKRHLDDRLAVELMFKYHHPALSKIVSNSNGLRSINNLFENGMFFVSRVLRKFRLNKLLPQSYSNNGFEFNLPALRHSGEESIYPLLSNNKMVDDVIGSIIDKTSVEKLYQKAIKGDIVSYEKLITLQAIAFSVLRFK